MTRRKRIALLLVFGVVLISAAAAYIEFHFHLPEGNGPAGPAVSGKPFEHVWSERKILMLGVGDSVTAGFGARHGYSYFDRLAATPVDEFEDMRGRALSRVLPNLTTRNLAVSGSNSLQHVQWVEEKLEKQPVDVFGLVVITSGGNDIIHWYGRSKPQEGAMYGSTIEQAAPWIARYESRLEQLFTTIEARFPGGCQIFIADIYDPSDGAGHPESAGLPAWPDVLTIHGAYNDACAAPPHATAPYAWCPCKMYFWGMVFTAGRFGRRIITLTIPITGMRQSGGSQRCGYDAIRRVFLNEIVKEAQAFQ